MIKILQKTFCVFIAIVFAMSYSYALEFDTSVDQEIRKNYNPSKLELENLPPVPSVNNVVPSAPITSIPRYEAILETPNHSPKLSYPTSKPISNIDKSTAIMINKGTKFTVKSYQTVSDTSRVGTRISFVSQLPVTKRYVTIPQGTVFKGKIVDSHSSQKTCNGGLIVIKIDGMTFKGSTIGVNAKITKAKYRHIFFNNIKGEHRYWKSVANSTKPGKRFYKKMMRSTSKLANGNFTVLLSPFTVIAGVTVYAVNIIGAPVFALFSEGGRITVPAGSEFEIKLLDDIYL